MKGCNKEDNMKPAKVRQQHGQIFKRRRAWFGRWRRDELETLPDGSKQIVRRQHCEKLADYGDRYRSKRDVQPLLDEKLKPLNEGRSSAESTLSVANYAENFFLPHAERELKPSTVHGYRGLFRMYLRPRVLEISLRDLRTVDVANLLRDLHRDHGLSRKSLGHVKGLLSSIYSHAVNAGVVDGANPVKLARIPKAAKGSEGTHAYSPSEIQTMLDTLTGSARTAVALMFFCGLRPGEARAARWENYDGTSLRITSSLWERHLTVPKTTDSVATVPVRNALAEILEPRQKSGFILAGPSGKPIDLHNTAARVCVPVLSACATCGKQRHEANGHAYAPVMEWRGWYACRRGLATAAAAVETPMAAKSLLRHRNLSTTLANYVKDEVGAGIRAAEKISALFENVSTTAVQ